MTEKWSGRIGFVLATIGWAVGLGSIWKFPYEVGTNGGAAFVLFYIAGLVLAVIPLMLAEFAIGRRGGGDAATSIDRRPHPQLLLLFLAIAAAIVARGVGHGIEAASKVLMPLLVILMLGLAAYGVVEGDAAATLRFLFRLDLSR